MPEDPECASLSHGSGTPQSVALAWVRAVMDQGDLGHAWPTTDPTLRLVLVQEWLWALRREVGLDAENREALAAALADPSPAHPLWSRFAAERVAGWHEVWRGFSTRTWRVTTDLEIVDLDTEMVTFVGPPDHGAPRSSTASALTRRFLLRHDAGGWLVSGLTGHQLFRPGWPPSSV